MKGQLGLYRFRALGLGSFGFRVLKPDILNLGQQNLSHMQASQTPQDMDGLLHGTLGRKDQ